MKIVIINHKKFDFDKPQQQPQDNVDRIIELHTRQAISGSSSLYVFQRATQNRKIEEKNITIFYIKDNYGESLRWCDNPDDLYQSVSAIRPDIVHMFNLALPLHFRWLRKELLPGVKIIGHHTGEHIWVQLRLFLQQFGLRTADAFFFENIIDAQPWLKAGAILPRQPVFEIPDSQTAIEQQLEKLDEYYRQLLA